MILLILIIWVWVSLALYEFDDIAKKNLEKQDEIKKALDRIGNRIGEIGGLIDDGAFK